MKIEYGNGSTTFGPGINIELSGDDIALAIYSYLVANNIHVTGPRTVSVNDELCKYGKVYVDPTGSVVAAGKLYSGSGP